MAEDGAGWRRMAEQEQEQEQGPAAGAAGAAGAAEAGAEQEQECCKWHHTEMLSGSRSSGV